MAKALPRILVVDDEESMRELYGALLSDVDYRVTFAADGEEALRKVALEQPEVMVLDLSMPRMGGFGVLEALCKAERRPKILVVTARHDSADIEKAITLGASDYLAKPFDAPQLLSRLTRLARVS